MMLFNKKTVLYLFTALFLFSILEAQVSVPKSTKWVIKKTEWSIADEKLFQEFVRGIGEAKKAGKCSTTFGCLTNKDANKLFYYKNPKKFTSIGVDCGRLPHILRAYFAWMNDLPFAYSSELRKAYANDPSKDIRYTANGNTITSMGFAKTGDDAMTVFARALGQNTARFRIHPENDFSEFYSPEISLQGIRPGTIVYDPSGHVLVVYKIEAGVIRMIDAHPDNSLSAPTYDTKFGRSRPAAGAGFKNWRPIKLVGATYDEASGGYVGGSVVTVPNRNISDFGLEQYYGTTTNLSDPQKDSKWKNGKFIIEERQLDYYDYVSAKLGGGNVMPVSRFQNMMLDLCSDLSYRAESVDAAFSHQINQKEHPSRLPQNIYGTDGEWESYSTPSRDARFRTGILYVRDSVKQFIEKFRARDEKIRYTGNDLVGDLLNVYNQVANDIQSCSINYRNSNNENVVLTLDQVIERAFRLSFDPYHCIELRWGAEGQELASCSDGAEKMDWYDAEQNLRNTLTRDYQNFNMNKTVDELATSQLGQENAPEISIKKMLEEI
ncbi:MAG TPA: hypothetical protein VI754_09145 [Bacteriovoracaceae bacterium]|nr:hypothetical protein [Bacteriovoracaceae bacterium]